MAYIIAFISSFSWAALDLSKKKLMNYCSAVEFLFFLSTAQALVFYIIFLFTNKPLAFPDTSLIAFFVALSLLFIGHLAFLKAIQISDFSSVVPLLSLIPVFSIMFAPFALGEWMSATQIAGSFAIVVSSFFIQSDNKKKFYLTKASWYMILAAFSWSLASIADKLVLKELDKIIYSFEQNLVICLCLGAYLFFTPSKKYFSQWSKPKAFFLFLSIMASMSAMYFQFWSLELLFVGVFSTFKGAISLFSALVFAKIFFKEKISTQKFISVLIMLVGVFLISR